MNKIKDRILTKACNLEVEILDAMHDFAHPSKSYLSRNVSRKFGNWTLYDCQDVLKFLYLLQNEEYKKAFQRLRSLSKERCLIPVTLEKDLWKLAEQDKFDHLF